MCITPIWHPDELLLLNKLDPHGSVISGNGFISSIVDTSERFLRYSSLKTAVISDRSMMMKWASAVGRTESPCYAMQA